MAKYSPATINGAFGQWLSVFHAAPVFYYENGKLLDQFPNKRKCGDFGAGLGKPIFSND